MEQAVSGGVITPQDREGDRQNCLDSEVLRMAEVAWPISEGGDGVVKEGSWYLKKWQAVRTVCQWNHDQDWKNSILQHTD